MKESPPPPPFSSLNDAFATVLRKIDGDEEVFGRRLLGLGSGPLAVDGAVSGTLALDADGAAVLIVALGSLLPEHAPQIADQLDRVSQMAGPGLTDAAVVPTTPEELRAKHAARFDLDPSRGPRLNSDQVAIVVVAEPPSLEAWRSLLIELGPQLRGVYELSNGEVTPVSAPSELIRPRPARSVGTIPLSTWLALFALLLGVGITIFAVARAMRADSPVPVTAVGAPVIPAPIREVLAGVLPDATSNQWIGQRRIVVTSDQKLIAVLPTAEGLQIVTDQRNLGRAWRSALSLPGLSATSYSVALDGADNLHLAYSDGSGIKYVFLRATADGFEAGEPLVLARRSTSPVVDIGWDGRQGSAHIVWAEGSGAGEAPKWAQVSVTDQEPRLVDSALLAPAHDDMSVLINVAVGAGSQVLTTYRRGDTTFGWFSRSGQPDQSGSIAWGPEERLPTGDGIGAASLALDDRGVAHLVLRDSTNHRLLYFRRGAGEGWTSGQTVVDGDAVEHLDYPIISVDTASRLIYVFFQTNESNPASEIVVAIRDPASGWEGPYGIASLTEGSLYPNSPSQVQGQSVVLWTRGGPAPAVQLARVSAP